MSSYLFALGAWAYAARRLVVGFWVVALVGGGLLALSVGTGTDDTYEFPGTESQDALDSLARTVPQFAGTSAQLIAVAPSGGDVTSSDFEDAVNNAITSLESVPQVSSVTSPYDGSGGNISSDNGAVLLTISLTVDVPEVLPSTSEMLQDEGQSLQQALPAGSQVAVGGQLYSQVEAGIGLSELASLGIALVVLLFTFGALIAAGMPLITAVTAVGVAVSIVFTATRFVTITSTAPLLAVMLGLAVGVDYGLFIISRHRDQLRDGMSPEDSAPRAIATAGSAVAFAAVTVIIALIGLSVARIPFLTVTGISAALAVMFAALVSLTLTPALLGFAGTRVLRRGQRPDVTDADAGEAPTEDAEEADAAVGATSAGANTPTDPDDVVVDADDLIDGEADDEVADNGAGSEGAGSAPLPAGSEESGFFHHWVHAVTRIPILTVLVVVGALVLLALPARDLRLALPDAGTLSEEEPGRIAYDLIADNFGPGYNGPLLLTGSVIQSTDPVTLVQDIANDVAQTPGVAAVPTATPNQSGDTAIIQVIANGAPDSEETQQLVNSLRDDEAYYLEEYAVELSVTGYTAIGIDISTRLTNSVLPFGLLVVGLSIVLLMMVFRSIVVPVAAALGYALSIGATLGILGLVYIDGVGAGALGVTQLGSITSFAPIIIMGVLFGLAMDYEIFLVSRMREDYAHYGDPRHAVERGFRASAGVVTPAALIMFTVFISFVPGGQASMQPIALGLALGVAIDAYIVRMVLTPAILVMFGHRSWWLPDWLDRVLPDVDVEGHALAKQEELADWPEPDSDVVIALEGVRTDGMREDAEELEVQVRPGEVLVVEGGDRDARANVLMALTGRLQVTDGRCKVAGYVLPTQAAWVRSRSAVAMLDSRDDPERAALDAAFDAPAVLALDGVDTVTDGAARREVARILDDARSGAAARSEQITVILGCASVDDVADLVPDGLERHVVTLDAAVAESLVEGVV